MSTALENFVIRMQGCGNSGWGLGSPSPEGPTLGFLSQGAEARIELLLKDQMEGPESREGHCKGRGTAPAHLS